MQRRETEERDVAGPHGPAPLVVASDLDGGAGFTAAPGLGLNTPVPPLMGQRCTNAHALRPRQPTLVSWDPSGQWM
eukprot:3874475-Pyramimonas_sp.AAC.1